MTTIADKYAAGRRGVSKKRRARPAGARVTTSTQSGVYRGSNVGMGTSKKNAALAAVDRKRSRTRGAAV